MASRLAGSLEEGIYAQVPLLSSIDAFDGVDMEKEPRISVVEIFHEPQSRRFTGRLPRFTIKNPRQALCIILAVFTFAAAVIATILFAIRGAHPSAPAVTPTPTTPQNTPSSQTAKTLSGLDIRLLPLGDSITAGFQSTDRNGYRKTLHDELSQHNHVEFIGSVKKGKMANNANEGHNGFRIDQIAEVCDHALDQQPSIVLLHAGTNSMRQGGYEDQASDRLGDLIDQIFDHVPNTTLLVAQIIGSFNATQQRLIDAFNAKIPDLVKERVETGKHIAVVDMSHALDADTDFTDQWHPNDQGYVKLGEAWFHAIEKVHQHGWIENAP